MKKDILQESLEFVQEHEEVNLEEVKLVHEMKMKEAELEKSKKFKIDWSLIANGAISIASILLVLNYEKENVITTKAWGVASKWIGKGK